MHPRILIVETEPQRAHSLRTGLEAAGFEVSVAADCTAAWTILRTESLALALIDANSDRNLLTSIRAEPRFAKLPVIVLGDAAASEQVVAWLSQGADGYISRFVSPVMLVAEVRAKLRRATLETDMKEANQAANSIFRAHKPQIPSIH